MKNLEPEPLVFTRPDRIVCDISWAKKRGVMTTKTKPKQKMTKQEMLASLEVQIRKDIPRLMKLKEGCILQNEWSKDFFKVYDKTENHIRIFQLNSDIPDEQVISEKHISTYIPLVIIGHDITLNDVLEWLKYLGFLTECSNINFDGNTFCKSKLVYDNDDNFLYKKTTFCEWNLPSPYLKDQPEDLIKFLYNLKKE